ncbi:3-hydroxyacyl-ACP dehydratase [Dyadobacter sp. CY356]|uniref:3-hydroxyacyl-ACP dehydratase n=1 Tax=Dyadobacter sp. CY356 TaxID=2906442 RepID=UPI001F242094|nr:3-hydroxyacyl-ACP dehydratase [Dyadobacter sp. CY356]MCF0056428.1 3-hydroxyacyl-ACP dehydratase [Dyadobacter sp. CY356]
MFPDSLYKITGFDVTPDTIFATISLNPDHIIFEGHFPDSPVLPGVVQLQIVKELLEKYLGRTLKMKTMRSAKFLQVINPKETPDVYIDIKLKSSEFLEVVASGSWGNVTFFKTQVSYT